MSVHGWARVVRSKPKSASVGECLALYEAIKAAEEWEPVVVADGHIAMWVRWAS